MGTRTIEQSDKKHCGNVTSTRRGLRGRRGQALLELTFVTPFLIMLTIVAIDFGGWLYSWTQIGNAARAVANYAALGPASVGTPTPANGSAISSLLAADLALLPNYSSSNPAVIICWNSNGSVSAPYGGFGSCTSSIAIGDPEASSYIAISVDLTYTYTPFIASFTFNTFGVHLPTLPTTIHRRVVMRLI